METNIYNLVSLIIMFAGFATTIIGLILIFQQLKQGIKTREVELCVSLAFKSISHEVQTHIDCIWRFAEKSDLSPEQEISAERVIVFFELIGTICQKGYMSTDLIEGYFGSIVTGSWDRLSKFIYKRRQLPYYKNYAVHFQRLAESLRGKPDVSPGPA